MPDARNGSSSTVEVPVLIAGGSLVGMSTALLLSHYGIRSLVVEHHRGTAIHPRAAQISQRTMEILRTVGIEQIVRRKSEDQFVQDGAIMAVETLAGKEIAYYIANLNEGVRDVSPCERVFISQSLLEPLLKTRAGELGAELRFATDLISFEQDASGGGGVTATVRDRDTGKTTTVRAQYMVAADGAHSRSRQQLGIPMTGHGTFSKSITIYFRGPMGQLLRGRNLSVIYVINDALRGFIRVEKPFDSGFLAVNALGDPGNPVTDLSGVTAERCRELVAAALGDDTVPVTIDNVMHWDAAADVAASYREGRVFLAGDSAHIMPPNGGFGGNTGIQDAQNLAWRLAWVLRGEASPALLDSYEAERRPVGHFTTEQAYTRYVTRTAPYLGTEGMQQAEPDLNIELGYVYRSAAVMADAGQDGSAAAEQPMHMSPRESSGRPGTRAPHIDLGSGSTLDFCGREFVLLTGSDGGKWLDAVRASSTRIAAHAVEAAEFPEAYGISSSGASLVRPDGFVAWRSHDDGDASAERLDGVIARICARG